MWFNCDKIQRYFHFDQIIEVNGKYNLVTLAVRGINRLIYFLSACQVHIKYVHLLQISGLHLGGTKEAVSVPTKKKNRCPPQKNLSTSMVTIFSRSDVRKKSISFFSCWRPRQITLRNYPPAPNIHIPMLYDKPFLDHQKGEKFKAFSRWRPFEVYFLKAEEKEN